MSSNTMFSFLKGRTRQNKRMVLTCFFTFFCNGALALTMGSVMPDLKAAYGLSDAVSGLMLSAHSLGNMAAGFLSGLAPFYLGEKRSVTLLHALAFLGYLMMLLSGNPLWLLLAFVLTGIGRGSVTNFDNRMMNRISGGDPAALNVLHGMFAVGAIAAPMSFLFFKRLASWRVSVMVLLGLGVLSLANLMTLQVENNFPKRQDKGNASLAFLKDAGFVVLALMMFCYLCSEYAINGWLVTYIQSKQSLSFGLARAGMEVKAYSQMMATLLWLVMLAGRLICAALSGRVGQKKLMLASSLGAALCFLILLSAGGLRAVSLSVAGLGLCMAGICPMIYADAARYTNRYPMATGALLAVGSFGAILMPAMVGAVAQRQGFAGGMRMILSTVLLLVVFSALNVLLGHRKKPDDPCCSAGN